nr:UTRA domain-containing protein [Paraburkholderia terrae]
MPLFTASKTLVGQTSTQRSHAVQRASLISSIKTIGPVRRAQVERTEHDSEAAVAQIEIDVRLTEIQRVRLLDGLAVSFELTYAAREVGEQLLVADLENRDIFHVIEQDCGVRIGHADLSIRSMPASEKVALALGVGPGSALLGIERLVHSRDGAPVLFEALSYRGDAFQYQLSIERAKR